MVALDRTPVLLGQWVTDVRALLDALQQRDGALPTALHLEGHGPAGLVALCAAALDTRITSVALKGTLASYISDVPFEGQRLGTMVPGILMEAGDIAQTAALIAPRKLAILGGVTGGGDVLDAAGLSTAYAYTREVYTQLEVTEQFTLQELKARYVAPSSTGNPYPRSPNIACGFSPAYDPIRPSLFRSFAKGNYT